MNFVKLETTWGDMSTTKERYEDLVGKKEALKDSVVQAKARLTALTERKDSILAELSKDYSINTEEALVEAISLLNSEVDKSLLEAEAILGKV